MLDCMNTRLLLLAGTLIVFGAITGLALQEVGYWGIIEPLFQSWGQRQVLADLTVALTLFLIWMVRDAPSRGLSAWPFVAATLVAGSFGPLLYLIIRELRASRT
jgi:hypothetical protein